MSNKNFMTLIAVAVGALVIIGFGLRAYKQIEAGHVGVAKILGKTVDSPFPPGPHLVNPLSEWTEYDVRQKSHFEKVSVPSQDQLITEVDISVQYNLKEEMTPQILNETGTANDVLEIHIVPKLRSLAREMGKRIKRAEEFFQEETQQLLQRDMEMGLREYLEPKGVNVDAVLLRDIQLPASITAAIEVKKEREQQAEQQKVELERYRTEQQQKVAQAQAEREAAEEEAKQREVLADAQAYEIEKINTAIANNPAYIKLQALEALKAISDSPSSKLFFIDSDSPQPLPLMNLSDDVTGAQAAAAAASRQNRPTE